MRDEGQPHGTSKAMGATMIVRTWVLRVTLGGGRNFLRGNEKSDGSTPRQEARKRQASDIPSTSWPSKRLKTRAGLRVLRQPVDQLPPLLNLATVIV